MLVVVCYACGLSSRFVVLDEVGAIVMQLCLLLEFRHPVLKGKRVPESKVKVVPNN